MSHSRIQASGLSGVHEREVAKLIAEGWSEGGFRRDLVRTIAQWYASNNGGRLATTDCRKGDRCRCTDGGG